MHEGRHLHIQGMHQDMCDTDAGCEYWGPTKVADLGTIECDSDEYELSVPFIPASATCPNQGVLVALIVCVADQYG
eukprot:COSAG02_NODE_66629_length_255_cov_0.576923_1_plen_75_part_10